MTLEALESDAAEFAQLAGELLVELFQSEIADGALRTQYWLKKGDEPVSKIDLQVEHYLIAQITARYPDDRVCSEELGVSGPKDSERLWIIDPIDGTKNLVAGFPLFSISICVATKSAPVVGAIWTSVTQELTRGVYHARRNGGMKLNGRLLAPILGEAKPGKRLAVLNTSMPCDRTSYSDRRIGSAAIEMIFVATGSIAYAWLPRACVWDVCAGVVMLREMNKNVWKLSGGKFKPYTLTKNISTLAEPHGCFCGAASQLSNFQLGFFEKF